jgi:predicted  nucleic acid-binding Zn-ribbon protein
VKDDVAALLEVQADDLRIYGIEDELSALAPKMAALEKDRQRAAGALAEAKQGADAESVRLRDLQDRLRQHRELRDRSETLLGQVTTPREAAAAMAQIDQAKKFIMDEEREVAAINQRIAEWREVIAQRDAAVQEIEQRQEEARAALGADRARLEQSLSEARSARDSKATRVPRALLQKYDRIRSKRRNTALYPLRGASCANCDTAIPVQRQSTMANTGSTELCEGCGVLLYAATE